MNTEDVKRLAMNPELIAGICNYCDRWCERCPFTSRCMNYAMGEERGISSESHDLQSQEFWDEMSSVCTLTLDLLRESAAEHGIDIDNLDMDGAAEEKARLEKRADGNPIASAAMAYMEATYKWLENAKKRFKEKGLGLQLEADLELPGSDPESDAGQISDAADVVSWYHTMIYPKVMRAIQQDADDKAWEEENGFPKDSDGSAKVALISIDRSIGAWGVLLEHFPDAEDDVLGMLVRLERMRKAIEREFPYARAFQRPGFDYIPAQPDDRDFDDDGDA